MTYREAIVALSDPRRREIFESLRSAPRTVAEIARRQPVSRPAVSQHLKVLAAAGLVEARADGTRRYYGIRREGLAGLKRWIDGFWDDVLQSFAAEVESRREGVMVEPIRRAIEVRCDPAAAFNIFTGKIASWWPLDRNSVSAMRGGVARSIVLEPRRGGQVYEITADGAREDWARITAFEPGRRLVLAWHVMAPEDQATQVEILFTPNGTGTRVDLVHRGWEILGAEAASRRGSYDSGWVHVFEDRFAKACAVA